MRLLHNELVRQVYKLAQSLIKGDQLASSGSQHLVRRLFQPDHGARLLHHTVFRIIHLNDQASIVAMLTVNPLFCGSVGGTGNLTLTKNNAPF